MIIQHHTDTRATYSGQHTPCCQSLNKTMLIAYSHMQKFCVFQQIETWLNRIIRHPTDVILHLIHSTYTGQHTPCCMVISVLLTCPFQEQFRTGQSRPGNIFSQNQSSAIKQLYKHQTILHTGNIHNFPMHFLLFAQQIQEFTAGGPT